MGVVTNIASILLGFATTFTGVRSFQIQPDNLPDEIQSDDLPVDLPFEFRQDSNSSSGQQSNDTSYVDWRICNSSDHSNLGDLGPDSGDSNIRFVDVATSWDGKVMDLIITNVTTYTPKDNSKNGRIDCMGNINMKTISATVTLEFSFVETGTETTVASSYLFTVYDIDYGKMGSENVNFLTAVTGYWTTSDTVLTKSGKVGSGSLKFSAGAQNVDNPSDPSNMTAEQMNSAVTVMYENTSTFQIKFSIDDADGKAGRNILFSGWSELAPTLEPTPVPTPVSTLAPTPVPTLGYTDWSLCNVENIVNNLGNLGPETDAGSGMRFKEVFSDSSGSAYDLMVTNTTTYQVHNISKNGQRGCFGLINVKAQTSVTLNFSFVESGTNTSAADANYWFTIWDIDQLSPTGTGGEMVKFITDVSAYDLTDDTSVSVSGSISSGLTFQSTTQGDESNNPTSLENITSTQKNNAGSVKYKSLSSFKIKFTASEEQTDGRNFMFSGFSQL